MAENEIKVSFTAEDGITPVVKKIEANLPNILKNSTFGQTDQKTIDFLKDMRSQFAEAQKSSVNFGKSIVTTDKSLLTLGGAFGLVATAGAGALAAVALVSKEFDNIVKLSKEKPELFTESQLSAVKDYAGEVNNLSTAWDKVRISQESALMQNVINPLLENWNKVIIANEGANVAIENGVPPQVALSQALQVTTFATQEAIDATSSYDQALLNHTNTVSVAQAQVIDYSDGYKEFEDVVFGVQTATERYDESVLKLQESLEAGKITNQEFGEGVMQAAAAYEEATNKMAFGIAQGMVEAGGITRNEAGFLLQLMGDLGLASEDSIGKAALIVDQAAAATAGAADYTGVLDSMGTNAASANDALGEMGPKMEGLVEPAALGQAALDGIATSNLEIRNTAFAAVEKLQGIGSAARELDGIHSVVTIDIIVNGSIPRFGNTPSGAGGQQNFRVNAGQGRAEGGPLGGKWLMVGDAPGGNWTPYTELVSPNGYVFDAKTSRMLKESGMVDIGQNFVMGGALSGEYIHPVTGNTIGSGGRSRRDRPDRTSTRRVAEDVNAEAPAPVVANLTNVVTNEVQRMGGAVANATVANVSATERQTARQEQSTKSLENEMRGMRSDFQRYIETNRDDLRSVMQEIL